MYLMVNKTQFLHACIFLAKLIPGFSVIVSPGLIHDLFLIILILLKYYFIFFSKCNFKNTAYFMYFYHPSHPHCSHATLSDTFAQQSPMCLISLHTGSNIKFLNTGTFLCTTEKLTPVSFNLELSRRSWA